MNIRLRLIYFITLLALSYDRIRLLTLSDDRWFFKVLELGFLLIYLFVLSKLLNKISSYYIIIPKESERIHLQPWGKYYIAIILFIYVALYLTSVNTSGFDAFYLLLAILIGYDDDMYQVVYKLDDKRYYYFEKQNISKEIKFYSITDKSVELSFDDGEPLNIKIGYKTRKSKQLISEFFE